MNMDDMMKLAKMNIKPMNTAKQIVVDGKYVEIKEATDEQLLNSYDELNKWYDDIDWALVNLDEAHLVERRLNNVYVELLNRNLI